MATTIEQENEALKSELAEMKRKCQALEDKHRSLYASSMCIPGPGPKKMPEEGMTARHAKTTILDQHTLDFKERLNTSSYVNVVFEPEELEVAVQGLRINLADQTVYPQSFKLHNDIVNMVAQLWNCPTPPDFEEYGCFAGAGTVGSTEGCLLGGLALKFRWRAWYAKKHGLSEEAVLAVRPNLVISSQFQAAWEKFFKYFDVECRIFEPSVNTFTFDPLKLEGLADDKTLGIVCIMGNHYGGQYDPVWDVDREVTRLNEENGWQLGIHVDGASGGFIAPFQELKPWDFRLPNVLSISASGHKFGQSACGTGWIVWRQRQDLSSHVAISVSYLGGKADSYTLNFSRPATGVYVQLYKFLRLGRSGYQQLEANQMAIAHQLREHLRQYTVDGKPRFRILDAAPEACLPVVTAMLNPELNLGYDDIDLQHALAEEHWYVSGYRMNYHHPTTEETLPLFSDMPANQTMFRIVVKSNLTPELAAHLMKAFDAALETLDGLNGGYRDLHAGIKQKVETQLTSNKQVC